MAATICLAAPLVGGCIFSPKTETKKVVPQPPIVYPPLSTPQAVLASLMLAYNHKDSVGYMKLYSRDYQGQSYDNNTGLQLAPLHWADERLHIQALQENHDVTTVSLNFPQPVGGWQRISYPGDPPGYATIEVQIPTLSIDLTSGTSYQLPAGETFEYKFVPTTPAPSSQTDTLWQVWKWTEIAPAPQ